MLVKDANDRVEAIDSEIRYWLDIKEIKELNEANINELYDDYKDIFSDIDSKIDRLYEERNNLNDFIDGHLKKTSNYDDLLKEIIHYKEELIEDYTWAEIAEIVHFSDEYCRKLYSRFKKQRDV